MPATQEQNDFNRSIRLEKYRLLAEGYDRISIAYLAEAVGVSKAAAVGELGQMVADGSFGVGAYIDYTTLELILPTASAHTSAHTASPADDVRAAWQQVKSTAGQQARIWAQQAARTAENAVKQAAQSVGQAAQTAGQTAQQPKSKPKPQQEQQRRTASSPPKPPVRPEKSGVRTSGAAEKPAPRTKRKAYVSLLLSGIAAAAAGVAGLAVSLDFLFADAFLAWLITGASLSAVGGGLLTVRGSLRRRDARYCKYQAYMTGRDWAGIPQLAAAAGVKPAKARRDLERMTADGLLGPAAYVDSGNDALITSPGVSSAAGTADPDASEDKYFVILRQLRQLDDEIADARVSELTRSIEDTCAKIFRIAQENPEKNANLKTFMGYYLPTALKLLRNYATLERQGIGGDNIDAAKQSIIRSLSTLENAFRVQLDKLFSSDALDAETDEDVLETMLRRDGLSGSDFEQTE